VLRSFGASGDSTYPDPGGVVLGAGGVLYGTDWFGNAVCSLAP
jgi:hypothetical protein